MGNTKTKLDIPSRPSYSQLYQLLSVASNCIKADRERITKLENEKIELIQRIEKLENRAVYILKTTDDNSKTT